MRTWLTRLRRVAGIPTILFERGDEVQPLFWLLAETDFVPLLADKAFNIDWIRAALVDRGATAVISPETDRKRHSCKFAMYRWRCLVENFFCNPKGFRRIAACYDKSTQASPP
jgi:transposase